MEDGSIKNGKKTWNELKQTLCELRRQLSALSCVVPSSINFRNIGDGSVRIYFLGTLANGWETTLYSADIPADAKAVASNGKLHWNQVVELQSSVGWSARGSREEQLLVERKRLTTWGITSYELHPTSAQIVFTANGTLYQTVDIPTRNGPLFPSEVRTSCPGSKITPVICPSNPDLIAFVCNLDIWVAHEPSGKCERVSYCHKGKNNIKDDALSAGTPCYVMQEEFSRYEGFWWQPNPPDGVQRLLYEEVDDSEVGLYSFPSSMSPLNGDVEQYRFPRAGSCNSKSNLKLAEIRVDETGNIEISTLELLQPLSNTVPWMEYLVRVGWTANRIWFEALDRKQERLELWLLPIESFTERPSNMYHHHIGPPQPLLVISQVSKVWINVHDLVFFLPETGNGQQEIIWGSEETGFMHLYLVTLQYNGLNHNSVDHSNQCKRAIVALTHGDWEVLDGGLWVDHKHRLVYFMAVRETPLEKHLYVVSLDAPGDVRLLTRPGYSYSIDINEECTIIVATYSSVEEPPACQVFIISHSDFTVNGVTLTPFGYLHQPQQVNGWLVAPELYRYKISSGDVLYAMVFRPHNYKPGVAYPTVLNVYGGPAVQTVSNTFKGMRHLRNHMLASQGYCVVMIDSRGSEHRGVSFESHIKHRMGMVELEDQIEVLKLLSSELEMIDMQRLAVYGWSYGGYLSLMAIARFSHIFKVCIAGAPVTSWLLYDTGYTERYMGLPEDNPLGYKAGSILNYINQFPDEENRLLIIHGLIDENVHFTHTSTLISHLISKGKPYQLQIYPGERHSLRSLDASKHYETLVMSFLQNNL